MIQIPGYRIVRTLGRGGMASVHLAIQQSVEREVALKIMAPTLLGDPQFGERFLREARIAARLRHPHVVQVHDVGVAGELHYIAMEYLPDGPITTREAGPKPPRYAIKVCREIASALGYAHARGVIHRDIKPDNILLREDGAAVLTDFGIARASDSVRMTMTGSIMGTPSYMSPEQARGVELDGRSDLYSLGIVFYELLTGRVPFVAGDALAVGLLHLQAPIPKLPDDVAWLQAPLERMLAKQPEQRYATGAEMEAALAAIEQRFTPTPVRTIELTATPRPVATQAIAPAHTPGEDSEPRIGAIDPALLNDSGRRRSSPLPATPSNRWPWLLLPLLATSAAALWFAFPQWRAPQATAVQVPAPAPPPAATDTASPEPSPPLAAAPEESLADRLRDAHAAYAAGRIDGDTRSALALYLHADALDPGNAEAEAGINNVLDALLEQGRQSLVGGDLDTAEARINRVAAIHPQHPRLPDLQRQLDSARNPKPDPAPALLSQLQRALADFEMERAERVLKQLAAPGVLTPARLADARARYDTALKRHQALQQSLAQGSDPALLARLIREAEAAIAAGDLWGPPGDSAYDKLRRVQSGAPQHAEAARLMQSLPEHARRLFDAALRSRQLERAFEFLRDLRNHSNDADPALPAMRVRLAQAYAARAEQQLAGGAAANARQALAKSAELDPGNPQLPALRARIETSGN